jgi:hypothetical protein
MSQFRALSAPRSRPHRAARPVFKPDQQQGAPTSRPTAPPPVVATPAFKPKSARCRGSPIGRKQEACWLGSRKNQPNAFPMRPTKARSVSRRSDKGPRKRALPTDGSSDGASGKIAGAERAVCECWMSHGTSGLDGSFREEVAKPLGSDHVALLVVQQDGLLESCSGLLMAVCDTQDLAEIG